MENKVKRIGVLTSGGDAPGMNAAVRAVVRTALTQGIECVGIRRGWNGLINSDFVRMDSASVSHIIDKGGTILYTARSKEFMTEEGRDQAPRRAATRLWPPASCWGWTGSSPSAATAPSGAPWRSPGRPPQPAPP